VLGLWKRVVGVWVCWWLVVCGFGLSVDEHLCVVTLYTSHVTRHTSHVTRHTSHVTGMILACRRLGGTRRRRNWRSLNAVSVCFGCVGGCGGGGRGDAYDDDNVNGDSDDDDAGDVFVQTVAQGFWSTSLETSRVIL